MSGSSCLGITLAAAAVALAGCAAPVSGPVVYDDPTPRIQQPRVETLASFECGGALPAVHRQICASDSLSRQDRQLAEQVRARLRDLDLPGSLLLEANQRQWLLSRAQQCNLSVDAGTEIQPQPQAIACLEASYRQRARDIADWPESQPRGRSGPHALSAYAQYRLVDDRSSGICSAMAEKFNDDLRVNGLPSPARLSGSTMIAGTHASTSSAQHNGAQINVNLYDAGPFAGYQMRARGMSVNGQAILDDRTLPRWVAEQPNYGGRAHASSSQTGDYGAIDVFDLDGQTLVLVNETWGFYSPAARGESAFAGLYSLNEQQLQPLCLYQTYLTPPRTNTLAGLPAYSALQTQLDLLAGEPLPQYAQHERRDNYQRWKEQQWTLLNLPLLGADEITRFGREPALRKRNDEALDTLFSWSERNLPNKLIYRRVLPMMQPAYQELVQMFQGQGLEATEAGAAADLLFHESLARAMENLQVPGQSPSVPLPPFASYTARYAFAPSPGDLEQGRNFATLHSVLLNNAPLNVVSDFIDYETGALGNDRGRGPDDNSAAMAAVNNPEALALLLQQGFEADQSNRWGKTALMTAAQLNRADSVSLLLNNGADVYRQTRSLPDTGVGGPDRAEAASGYQTALLLAAENADAELIRSLLDADAARQAWAGYNQQVCSNLESNKRLSSNEIEAFKAPLCAVAYTPPPIERQPQGNLRNGEALVIRDEGIHYPVTLRERPAMSLFGRSVELSPRGFSPGSKKHCYQGRHCCIPQGEGGYNRTIDFGFQ